MATLEIPSNVKCITSGQVPTTTNLKDGEFAFGKVGGVAKLYGNVNGVIIDFTGDVSLPITFSGASPGPGSGGTIIQGTYTSGYPAAAMIHLESPTYKTLLSPVQIAMFCESAGHTYKLELAPTGIGYTYDGAAYIILRQDNVKTLFGNQSIYGSGNIDLYKHILFIDYSGGSVYCTWISSSNTQIDSLTDLYTALSGTKISASGYHRINTKPHWIYAIQGNSAGGIFCTNEADDNQKISWASLTGVKVTDTVTTV